MASQVWRIWLLFAWAYVLSYALRVINAVVGPPLMQEVGLSNADLGLISAAYFITFAGMQLPLGVWLDRYGSRRTESLLLLFGALGCALFACSHSFSGLWLARALIGIGVSGCLMAAMKAFRQWFASERQSQLGAAMFVAGTMGALSATVPVNSALPMMGWRGVFWLMAGLMVIASILLWSGLRRMELSHADAPGARENPSSSKRNEGMAGYLEVFADPYFRRLALIGFVHQASFMAIQSLWAGLWMGQVLMFDKSRTADVLFAVNLSLLAGYLVAAWLAPRHITIDGADARDRRIPLSRVVGAGLLATILVQAAIIALPMSSAWILWPLLALCSTAAPLVQSHISLTFPPQLAGRANTAYNFLLFVGAFLVQSGIGLGIAVIKSHGHGSSDAMRLAFGALLGLQILALWSFIRNPAKVRLQ